MYQPFERERESDREGVLLRRGEGADRSNHHNKPAKEHQSPSTSPGEPQRQVQVDAAGAPGDDVAALRGHLAGQKTANAGRQDVDGPDFAQRNTSITWGPARER